MIRRFVYLQVHRDYLLGRVIGSGGIAIRKDSSHLSHPRSPFGEFMPMRNLIRLLLQELGAFRFGLIGPTALVHLVPEWKGGYTHAELRAFKQATEDAGVNFAFLLDHQYGPLTDHQVMDAFQRAGWWRSFS